MTSANDLLTRPGWAEADLGRPLPQDPHAVSVCMPHWDHVVGYEEEDPAIIDRLACGYPRFLVHPFVRQLAAKVQADLALPPSQEPWLFSSPQAAQRVATYAGQERTRIVAWEGLHVVIAPRDRPEAKFAWRIYGEGISSRRAEAILTQQPTFTDDTSKDWIRKDIAQRLSLSADDVFLFPSGIAAMATAHRLTQTLHPGKPSVQVDFPYVDVLKVQEAHPAGAQLLSSRELPDVDPSSLSSIFTEISSNPTLQTPNLAQLAEQLRPHRVPLVADDTIATACNVDLSPHADIITTSLTKFYSGEGNVLAGSLILVRDSPLYEPLREAIEADYGNDLAPVDAAVLAANARDFPQRVQRINANAEQVFHHLEGHPSLETLWYSANQQPKAYQALMRQGAGYGGLLSFLPRSAPNRSPEIYNRLRVSKGPSLGTTFTLACPYMLLAHYPELDWTDSLGIDRHLIRLSIGTEEPNDLIERLNEALRS
ncbi:MAG: PLP-dependent transferase [Verrucomicrobiota bacterium]